MLVAYLVLFLIGHLASRICLLDLLALIGGDTDRKSIPSYLSTMAMSVTLSLAVWGMVSVDWYWAAGAFAGGAALAALLVTRTNLTRWRSVSLIFDAATVAGGVYLWIWHWPFGELRL